MVSGATGAGDQREEVGRDRKGSSGLGIEKLREMVGQDCAEC